MLKRRIIFSLTFIFFAIVSIVFLDKSIFVLSFGIIPFLFYFTNLLKVRMPVLYEYVFLLFILFSTGFGSMFDFYEQFKYYDMILHIFAGVIFSFLGLFYLEKYYSKTNQYLKLILVFLISLGFASIWEMYEYFIDMLFGFNMQRIEEGLIDTMSDVSFHALGSLLCLIIVHIDYAYMNNRFNNYLKKVLSIEESINDYNI